MPGFRVNSISVGQLLPGWSNIGAESSKQLLPVKRFLTSLVLLQSFFCSIAWADDESAGKSSSQEDGASAENKAGKDFELHPGPFFDRRKLILTQIQWLASHNTGVKPFQDLLSQIEDEIQTDQAQAEKDIIFLEQKIQEQAKTLQAAGIRSYQTPTLRSGAGSGGIHPLTSGQEIESRRILREVDQFDRRINEWDRQGRDVLTLRANTALIRSWLRTPSMFQQAHATLQQLNAFIAHPPAMK